MKSLIPLFTSALLTASAIAARADDLSFSDPAAVRAAPAGAVGQAERSPQLDAMPGFQSPPPGFGIVPFFWWLGDPLTKERLHWEMDQMSSMHMSGFQINYAHSDRGGHSYGLTYPSEPPLFSEEWWKLTGWFMHEAKKQGASVSLSDYTLGFGQGWYVDEALKECPELRGAVLEHVVKDFDAGGEVSWELPADTLAVTAYRLEGTNIVPKSDVDLRDQVNEGKLRWNAPPGRWQIIAVHQRVVPWSLDPMNVKTGPKIIETFFQRFETRFPGESGKGLNFFFSDELQFGVSGQLWTGRFAEEFRRRKGYDIISELPALFADVGPRTPKVRLDFRDVMVSLSEEGYFRPLFDWHQERGMIYGCDHGGRGRDVVEFGDYFRTQRWNQGPGSDQPNLGKDLIKAKVASSIAHLYRRPRVWLEGYYGSGWGTSSADIVDATFADFAMGYNLLSFHGMYYSTHGGWWEWAPPDNTFRMPYWRHLRSFADCTQRLSYLLSQGDHRCDVAIIYPVAPVEAGMGGQEAVETAFRTGEQLYAKSIDFDFIDFESLARAKVFGTELHVSGEIYRVLVLPAMKAARHSTLQKALEFQRAGGIVIALGALPEASDRVGRDDPEVAAIVKQVFPQGVENDVFARLPSRDYEGVGCVLHRKIGPRDLYAIYGGGRASECRFRATGKVELWDPWTGSAQSLPVVSQTDEHTTLRLPLSEKAIQLIVFSPGKAEVARTSSEKSAEIVDVKGDWEFELQPTMDNRFGDFHWPPTPTLIGAEVRQLEYCEGDNKDGPWRKVTCSFGPQFIESERMPADPQSSPTEGKPYEFSWRWGVEGDPGHQGYHGLKGEIHDEFLAIGKSEVTGTGTIYHADDKDHYLWTTVVAPREMTAHGLAGGIPPTRVWLNGEVVTGDVLKLKAGFNPLLLQYDKPGRTYFVVSASEPPGSEPNRLAMRWWNNPGILPFDVRPSEKTPIGWYRFVSPPGLRAMSVTERGKVQAWADGQLLEGGQKFIVKKPSPKPVSMLLRIEQERGCYGGAALPEPIRLDCGPGRIELGDWSKIDGLLSYSGGAWYRKNVTIPLARQVLLDLGNVVASAEVRVNGHSAGIRVSPPWSIDITEFVHPGENRIEVLVCNTLANHYTTIPTRYRGSTESGLLGPVTLRVAR